MAKGKKNTTEGDGLQSLINYVRNRAEKLEDELKRELEKKSDDVSKQIREIKKKPSWLWAILQIGGVTILLASWWFQNKSLVEVSERKNEAIRRLSDLARSENSIFLFDMHNDVLKPYDEDSAVKERRAYAVTMKLIICLDALKSIYRGLPDDIVVEGTRVSKDYKQWMVNKLEDWLTDVNAASSYGAKYIDTLDYYDKMIEPHKNHSLKFVDAYRAKNEELAKEEYYYSNRYIWLYILGSILLLAGILKDYF